MSRVRTKLAKMLGYALTAELGRGVYVLPRDLHPAKGFYRSNPNRDNYVWEGFARMRDNNTIISVNSYTTMTKIIASKGIVLQRDKSIMSFDVYDATGN